MKQALVWVLELSICLAPVIAVGHPLPAAVDTIKCGELLNGAHGQPKNQQFGMVTSEDLAKMVSSFDQDSWAKAHFSQPTNHDQTNFRYLVHASKEIGFYETFLEKRILGGFEGIRMSIIDQDHTNTFYGAGVILEVPQTNIFAAHASDMGSSPDRFGEALRDRFSQVIRKFGLPSPDTILGKSLRQPTISAAIGHNEVVAVGTDAHGNEIKISGVFIKVDSLGHPQLPPALLKSITETAARSGLPLILIGPPRGFVTVRVEYGDGGQYVVQATSQEFARLQAAAQKMGTKLMGVWSDFIMANGVFEGDQFISSNDLRDYQELAKEYPKAFIHPFKFSSP